MTPGRLRIPARSALAGILSLCHTCGQQFPRAPGGKLMNRASPCNLDAFSRRSFFQIGGAASAALASGILGEPFLALSARAASLPHGPFPKDAVIIDANENPLGPCSAAREAIAEITANSARYQSSFPDD